MKRLYKVFNKKSKLYSICSIVRPVTNNKSGSVRRGRTISQQHLNLVVMLRNDMVSERDEQENRNWICNRNAAQVTFLGIRPFFISQNLICIEFLYRVSVTFVNYCYKLHSKFYTLLFSFLY